MVPFYAFLIYVENANQVLDSSHIIGICARVGRRMTRGSAKGTAVFSAVRGVNEAVLCRLCGTSQTALGTRVSVCLCTALVSPGCVTRPCLHPAGVSFFTDKISIHCVPQAWNGEAMSLLHSWKCFVCLTLNLLPSTHSGSAICSWGCCQVSGLESQFLCLASLGKQNILNLLLENSVVSTTFQMSFLPVHDFYITQAALNLHPWVFLFSHQAVQKMYNLGVISGFFPHPPFPCGFSWITWILLTLNPLS